MKKVKLWFIGFWSDFDKEDNMFTQILRKRFDLQITENDPDFLIFSPLCAPFEYEKYDCPRIMYTGEYISADFTSVDYFIGYDDISFGDRSLRFPLFLYNNDNGKYNVKSLTKDEAYRKLKEKKYFCNYIFGHKSQAGIREEILQKLSEYKRVECAGRYLNNMPEGKTYSLLDNHLMLSACKFTIAAESVCYPGFTSEKIINAFCSHSIPIYFGDPDINKCFNEKAYINCQNFKSIDDAVKRIIELDNDDEQYVDMLCQQWFLTENYRERKYNELEQFLWHIFDQTKEEAYRRPRYYRSYWHEQYLKDYNRYMLSKPHRLLKKLGL